LSLAAWFPLLGKGLSSASLAYLLQSRGYKVSLRKLDPYLNVDPGTMSPFQHGEVFVTDDGAETDLDLGHYERFSGVTAKKTDNITTGKIYSDVLKKERKGQYLGKTVQVIPHITDRIKEFIKYDTTKEDFVICEIGGIVGDIESLPFVEAIRQFSNDVGKKNSLFIHLTLVPYLKASDEIKTKPTQHSVKELRSIGIQPDIIICRSERPIPLEQRKKIALFTNVAEEAVVTLLDAKSIYAIPRDLETRGLDKTVLTRLALDCPKPDLSDWDWVAENHSNPKHEITIAMVGKYVELLDAYKSLNEALIHGGIRNQTKVNIRYIDSENLKDQISLLDNCNGILVPGGFGIRGVEGKINAVNYARTKKIPYLGICLGMQVAMIEFARNVCNLKGANSTEFDQKTPHPIIALITEWVDSSGSVETRDEDSDLGGTMRLGGQASYLIEGTTAHDIYGKNMIFERHRHRYEVNNNYVVQLQNGGMKVGGWSENKSLVEMIEISDHPWFVACQFHPEFTSTPRNGHPLFTSFIEASLKQQKSSEFLGKADL